MVLVRPITLNFTKPIVFLLNLYIALTYGLLHIHFESFPIAFVEIYGFSLGQEGLAFLSNHDRQPRHYPSLLRPSAPCLRKAVQRERRAKARETPPARHGRRLLHPSLPVLVRLERTAQYPLDHANHRLRLLFRRRFPALQFCPQLPLRRLSGLCCLSIRR